MMADAIVWLAIAFLFVMTYSLCVNASKWDEISEEYWDEYWGKDTKEEEDGLL